MADEARRIDNKGKRQKSFKRRTDTLFSKASDLSEEFGAHVVIVAFSPAGKPYAYGAPTVESVLHTYLPEAASGLPTPGTETAAEAVARVDRMEQELEETKALVKEGCVGPAAASKIVREAETSAAIPNWWKVDVNTLGEEKLPMFIRDLENLETEVKRRIDAMASARKALPTEKKQQQ